jgi:hypothetical protein
MERIVTILEETQVASYKMAEIIVRNMQPHTIAETVILPACKQIVKSVSGVAAKSETSNVLLSSDTIPRRTETCSLTSRNK